MSAKTALPSVNERKTENHTSNGHSRMEAVSRSVRSGGRNRNSGSSGSEDQHPHIGNYRLLKTIGKGNFAKVKLGRHILTGREVAVKIIDRTQLNPTSLQKACFESPGLYPGLQGNDAIYVRKGGHHGLGNVVLVCGT